jgi:hypothetical protein
MADRCLGGPGINDIARLAPLEELDRALVLLGGGAAAKRPEIAAPAGLRILLAGIQPVVSRLQLPDHWFRALVRAAFRADALRTAADRRRAALFACLDSALRDAAPRPSRLRALRVARDRRADGRERFRPARVADAALRLVDSLAFEGGAGSETPARRAFDNPMATACFVDRAPCLPSRM